MKAEIATRLAALGMLGMGAMPCAAQEEWTFLDNGRIRIGVNRSAGGAVGWFSETGAGENLLNHYDHGRYVQQSWYGDEDGSDWNGKPWRWNPVQGGGWRGEAAETLEWRTDSPASLYAQTRPRHWATGKPVDEVRFEQWITLEDRVARIRFRMTHTGEASHAPRHQELPAVFVNGRHTTLVHYAGDAPWTGGEPARSIPGWPNEGRKITENWAAYIDPETDRGIGVYVPVADEITCYRFGQKGGRDECSYFAPVKTLAVTRGFTFEYEVFMTAGTVAEMRERFGRIRAAAGAAKP
jgi:hypothetical protein